MHLLKLIMSDKNGPKSFFVYKQAHNYRGTDPSHRWQVAQYTLWPWGCAVLLNLRLLITSFLTICRTLPHQSAYRRHHSTETSPLYINAIGSQKLSCLCPLDLCCLWYHRPWHLLTRLSSWFGISGSVLGPLLSIMYTTLSTLISSLSLYHTFFSIFSSLRLSGKHHSSPECSHIDHFLDDF